MKYPIDKQTTSTLMGHIVAHERSQRDMVDALTLIMEVAIIDFDEKYPTSDNDEIPDWYSEAKKMMNIQKKIKMEHDNRLFNEKNGHAEKTTLVGPFGEISEMITDPEVNKKMNDTEKSFGEEVSEEELAKMFQEKIQKKSGVNLSTKEPFKGMSLDEIEAWEAKQENSNDIYKVKARIANLAIGISGGHLTPVGTMMVNSFVHVVKDLYDFADTLTDKDLRIRLIGRIRHHESMPGTLIAAAAAGVKVNK